MADHVRKDSHGPLDQEDAWRKIRASQRLHFGVSRIATWSDENLHLRISEMRDHKKIRTVRSPRTRTVDLSSISESRLSRLGVTRISI
jgi:hypothetical protein